MNTPQVWNTLPESEKLAAFNMAAHEANMVTTDGRVVVSRPFLPLGRYSNLESLMNRDFPRGEERRLPSCEPTLENYTTLYNFLGGKCARCGSDDIYWDQGDKSLVTYCPCCREECFFIRGDWLAYNSVNLHA
jgi:hypothetical protein